MNKPSHPMISSDGGNSAYDGDAYGWAIEQAAHLRAERADLLDWENLAEEIEGMAKSERRAAESGLRNIIKHILKWDAQPERRGRSWQNSIRNGRAQYIDTLEDNPSLATIADDMRDRAWRRARRDAAAEMDIDEALLPSEPFPWDRILKRVISCG
jgi:hypothetical protein